MIQNYCRTCGTKVLVKSVCHNCGCPPWKGNEYCGNCGSATKPNAILCVHCGIAFKNDSKKLLVGLIGIAIILILSWGSYFIYQSGSNNSRQISAAPINNLKDTPVKTVANKSPEHLTTIKNDAPVEQPLQQKPEVKNLPKQVAELPLEIKKESAPKKATANIFSFKELDAYTIDCSFYSQKNNASSVIFFKTRSLGYIKVNGKISELKLKLQNEEQGILKFANNDYEVMVEIEGLSGNADAWISTGTLSLSSLNEGSMSRYKIYSSCIAFK